MKTWIFAAAALAGLATAAAPVQATLLTPGAKPVALTPLKQLPAGSIVSNNGNVTTETFIGTFNGHSAAVGTLYLAVYREAATGFLDFLFQIQTVKRNADAIMRHLLVNVKGADAYIDASFLRTGPAGKVPKGFFNLSSEQAPTSADLSKDGTTVGFTFGHGEQGLGPGTTSAVFMIRTHVKGFRQGTATIITRETSSILPAFAPGPEPSTLVLFAGCFLGLAGWTGWRRWQRASRGN